MAILLLGIWLSSGTLVPYAAVSHDFLVLEPCKYLANVDHTHFRATFDFLSGEERSTWIFSVVLRRLLYPVLAFPFMRAFGFEAGGLFFNSLLHLVTMLFFIGWFHRRHGARAGRNFAYLLSTYPGISYWVGLPYSYACIVPFSLLSYWILDELERNECASRRMFLALLLGVLFTGYDLQPFFGVAAVLIAMQKFGLKETLLHILLMAVPISTIMFFLSWMFDVPLVNGNSSIYLTVLGSYAHVGNWGIVGEILSKVPRVLVDSFVWGNFVFIPILFLLAFIVSYQCPAPRLTRAERNILIAGLIVFLINNLAPEYQGWQMRGSDIVRLYQPLFVIMLTFLSRTLASPKLMKLSSSLLALCVVCNGLIVLSPILDITWGNYVYYRFYSLHIPVGKISENLDRYGRRPYGFCYPSPHHSESDLQNSAL